MIVDQFAEFYRTCNELTEVEKMLLRNEYLLFHENHEERLSVLVGNEARKFMKQYYTKYPSEKAKNALAVERKITCRLVACGVIAKKCVRAWLIGEGFPLDSATCYPLIETAKVNDLGPYAHTGCVPGHISSAEMPGEIKANLTAFLYLQFEVFKKRVFRRTF